MLLVLWAGGWGQSEGAEGTGQWVRQEDFTLRDNVQRERLLYQRERALASRLRNLLAMEEAEVISSSPAVHSPVTKSASGIIITATPVSADAVSGPAASTAPVPAMAMDYSSTQEEG